MACEAKHAAREAMCLAREAGHAAGQDAYIAYEAEFVSLHDARGAGEDCGVPLCARRSKSRNPRLLRAEGWIGRDEPQHMLAGNIVDLYSHSSASRSSVADAWAENNQDLPQSSPAPRGRDRVGAAMENLTSSKVLPLPWKT